MSSGAHLVRSRGWKAVRVVIKVNCKITVRSNLCEFSSVNYQFFQIFYYYTIIRKKNVPIENSNLLENSTIETEFIVSYRASFSIIFIVSAIFHYVNTINLFPLTKIVHSDKQSYLSQSRNYNLFSLIG